jgi:hypothetical protein
MINLFLAQFILLTSLSAQADLTVPKVIETYCAGCHNGRMRSPSGVLLDQFDPSHIAAQPDLWSRVYRQLQAGTMPPVGATRPDRATYATVLTSIEQAMSAEGYSQSAAAVNSQEMARRLATLLWDSAPDAALLEDAQRGRLNDPAILERQIHRMLADDRAQNLVTRFFFPWLELDKLGNSDPDKKYFPDYDVSLRDSLAKET